jgi:lipoprotein-anchoring transpeptidase ErfK/SrfK
MSRQFMVSSGRRRRRQGSRLLIGLVLIAGLGGGAYVYLGQEPDAANSSNTLPDREPAATGAEPGGDAKPSSAAGTDTPATPSEPPNNDAGPSAAGDDAPADAEPPAPEPQRLDLAGPPPQRQAEPEPEPDQQRARQDTGRSPPRTSDDQSIASLARDYRDRGSDGDTLSRGMELIEAGQWVEGRQVLSRVLFAGGQQLADQKVQAIRDTLSRVNEKLIFSSTRTERAQADPLTTFYTVQSGDTLGRIAAKFDVPYQIIAAINGIDDPRRLRVGQTIKAVQGPFHARIIKRQFALDAYLRAPSGEPIYVKTFAVGLGEDNSTPLGSWRVGKRKAKNPAWTNPRTGAHYKADDSQNPIGEYWVPLKGVGPNTSGKTGYGIHGTIEPQSIGQQMSMGCIRLRHEDIKMLFGMLQGGQSTVQIIE